jgi:hypothetical protein
VVSKRRDCAENKQCQKNAGQLRFHCEIPFRAE